MGRNCCRETKGMPKRGKEKRKKKGKESMGIEETLPNGGEKTNHMQDWTSIQLYI